MSRFSRGQQGPLARPAWGSGGGGAPRASSPEPLGHLAGSNAGDAATKEELLAQYQAEIDELRNVLAKKDQKIADLQRSDTNNSRMKRDTRSLAAELHEARRQLSDRSAENRELKAQAQTSRRESGSGVSGAERLSPDKGSEWGDAAVASAQFEQQERKLAHLEEENRTLRDHIHSLQKAAGGASSQRIGPAAAHLVPATGASAAAAPAGVGTTHAPDQEFQLQIQMMNGSHFLMNDNRTGDMILMLKNKIAAFQKIHVQQIKLSYGEELLEDGRSIADCGIPAGAALDLVIQDLPAGVGNQVVYSTSRTENTATLGPTNLPGVGMVDGVSSVALVLLQRINSSVCGPSKRAAAAQAAAAVPLAPGMQYYGQQIQVPIAGMTNMM